MKNKNEKRADKIIYPPPYKILALFGKSGAGKDTLKKWILENMPNTKGVISYTTRPKRDYEINGKDYYFIERADFDSMRQEGSLIETSHFKTWNYGTSINELSSKQINIGVFNIQSIQMMCADARLKVLPVWVDAAPGLRVERIIKREKNPNYEEICRRFLADEKDFKNIPFSFVTINTDNDDNFSNSSYCSIVESLLSSLTKD